MDMHHEVTANVDCGDTKKLARAITRLCEADGMRLVQTTPVPLDVEAPAEHSNF